MKQLRVRLHFRKNPVAREFRMGCMDKAEYSVRSWSIGQEKSTSPAQGSSDNGIREGSTELRDAREVKSVGPQ